MPVSSYPQVLPRRHGAAPDTFTSATPADVSAVQCWRSPGCDAQEMRLCPVVWVSAGLAVCVAGGVPCAEAAPPRRAATSRQSETVPGRMIRVGYCPLPLVPWTSNRCDDAAYGLPSSALEICAMARCARTLLPDSSSGGETTAIPNLPGDTAMLPPPTPLLAGRPV